MSGPASSTRRIPLPPPPTTAFPKTGNGNRAASSTSVSTSVDGGDGLKSRHPSSFGGSNGSSLVAGEFEDLSAWSDKDQAGRITGLGKCRVLGEESIAGIGRLSPTLRRSLDHDVDVKVRADRTATLTNRVALVSRYAVLGPTVLVREDRNRSYVEFVTCTERTDRDLTAVGN